jgi:hypothetical protein
MKNTMWCISVDTHPALVLQEWPVSTAMRIEQVTLREIRLRPKAPFEPAREFDWNHCSPKTNGLGYEFKTEMIEALIAQRRIWKYRTRVTAQPSSENNKEIAIHD